jgi:dephospho-CoA kinase
MLVGITGRMGSGKGEVAKILVDDFGFKRFTFSEELRSIAILRGMGINRSNLQDLGNELRKKMGTGFLSRRILNKIKGGENNVLEGIRNPGEIFELKREKNFILICVEASDLVRFERIKKRNRNGDPGNYLEFKELDSRDFGFGEEEEGQQVLKCISMSDYFLSNDGNLESLKKGVSELLGEIKC